MKATAIVGGKVVTFALSRGLAAAHRHNKGCTLSTADAVSAVEAKRREHTERRMDEVVFKVTQEASGGFVAECLTESIWTQADQWDELCANVRDAVDGFFFDQPKPARIRLHHVRDEVLAMA